MKEIEKGILIKEAHENKLVTQFNRLVMYDFAISEHLSQLNSAEDEVKYRPEFLDALNFTTVLIRRSVFSTYLDILHSGNEKLVKQTNDVFRLVEDYKVGKRDTISFTGNLAEASRNIGWFVKHIRDLEYERRYRNRSRR